MYTISEACTQCDECREQCPVDAISKGAPYKISDDCTDCGICAEVCPVDAAYRVSN